MTSRAKGFRWHRRGINDYAVDFRHDTDPQLDDGETLVASPAPALEVIRRSADGSIEDVLAEFHVTDLQTSDDLVTWRKGEAATGEQDAGTNYELLVLVSTSAGRRLASAHPLEVVETGDPDAP